MPAYSWTDSFYQMDPANPPDPDTPLTAVDLVAVDRRGDGWLDPGSRDTIDGTRFSDAWVGDTVTVRFPDGSEKEITGVTFYLVDGRRFFSPIDGSTLKDATFVSSTYVTSSGPVQNAQMEMVVCFAAGTMIAVPGGARPVERLRPGDLVETLDHGPRPVRWVGRRVVDGRGAYAPVRFDPGAIGNSRVLRVSPQHRMLVAGWRVELHFAETEVLVPAKHLVNGDTIRIEPCDAVEYVHLCFDRHEILRAEGALAESFLPGEQVLTQGGATLREILAIFPELAGRRGRGWRPARPVLGGREARLVA